MAKTVKREGTVVEEIKNIKFLLRFRLFVLFH